jgi:hypothetical protein
MSLACSAFLFSQTGRSRRTTALCREKIGNNAINLSFGLKASGGKSNQLDSDRVEPEFSGGEVRVVIGVHILFERRMFMNQQQTVRNSRAGLWTAMVGILVVAAMTTATVAPANAAEAPKQQKLPNILVIMGDDIGRRSALNWG